MASLMEEEFFDEDDEEEKCGGSPKAGGAPNNLDYTIIQAIAAQPKISEKSRPQTMVPQVQEDGEMLHTL